MPKILFLEAGVSAGEALLRAAHDLGVDAWVATHEEMYTQYPPETRALVTGTVRPDFTDPATALEELTAFCRRTGIDGVLACWEFLTPLAARLADRLGLPGHDAALAPACRNKRLMAEAFTAYGVPAPRTVSAPDADTLARRVTAAALTYPLVVKPAENAASIGVRVVASPGDLPEAVALAGAETVKLPHGIALEPTLLAQEYAHGEEFSVETVVARGAIHHLAVTEKFTTRGAVRAETGHTVPADLAPPARTTLLAAASRAVSALGLRDGLAHTEIKLDARGRASVLETGARPPGDGIMELVERATGVDMARTAVQVALGRASDLAPTRAGAAAVRFLTAPHAGTLLAVDGLPATGPGLAVTLTKQPGDHLADPTDNLQRIGRVAVHGATAAEVNETARRALAAIRITVGP
ncbi:ATP-grasp domain-containing protein [Streptomyces seoulensis]|nr:ATP-grasp domain-containing protein [Streptomyces seoulensis]